MSLAIAILSFLGSLIMLVGKIEERRATKRPEREIEEMDDEIDKVTISGTDLERGALLNELLDKAERSGGDRRQ